MDYQHLIEINNPDQALLMPLTRAQLWQGLLLRVEKPDLFLPQLENFSATRHDDANLSRALNFGSVVIHDQVRLTPQQQIEIAIVAPDEHAGSLLVIRIEEPENGRLFLRFSYTTTLEDEEAIEYVKSAYRQADIDAVKIMRKLLTQ
ncbi:MAG: AtaL-like protein [Chitinivorax sp.]